MMALRWGLPMQLVARPLANGYIGGRPREID